MRNDTRMSSPPTPTPTPTPTPARSRKLRPRHIAACILVVAALVLHGCLWSITGVPESRALWGDEVRYWQGATLLSSGATWHPDPLWPPLYPRFLAAVLAAGGSITAVQAVQTLMLLAVALLLCDLTRHLTGSRFAGAAAGALAFTYPPLAAFAHYLWPEVLHLLLFIGALWLLVRRPPRPPWLLAAGVLLGLALLTKSLLGPFLPLLLALEGSLKERALRVSLVAIAICAVIAPTAISNHRRGTGVIIADSLAFNLWVGLNERSKKNFVDSEVGPQWRAYSASAPTFPERRAILWAKIKVFSEQHGSGEILRRQLARQPIRLFDKDSFLTDMLPGGAIADRGRGYHRPPWPIALGLRVSSYLAYAVVLVASALGIAVCPPRGRRWLLIALLFIAYNMVIFLLLHVKSRYRVQILPFLFLYSGCAVAWAAHRLGLNPGEARLWSGTIKPRVWWATTPMALLLLFLAFGRGLVG